MADKQPSRNTQAASAIGGRLRSQRVDKLGKSLRDVAKLVGCAPIHLSDIETGKRFPSDELLQEIARVYQFPEAELRAGFHRPDSDVIELASENAVAAAKVPIFLREARGISAEQWDALIKQARKLPRDKPS
jgi:transcriptional regulator with XRE-family HTH domain